MKAQRYWWVLAGDESGITLHRHAERGTAEHHYYAMRTVGGPKLIGRINRAATMNTAYRMIADARPGVRLDVCNHD